MRFRVSRTLLLVLAGMTLLAVALLVWTSAPRSEWTDDEIVTLRSLWIGGLPDLPADPSNVFADDPRAAELGYHLFFDTRFSVNGRVACATCHQADRQFQDDLPFAQGIGTTTRRTMTVVGTAYSPWLFWDGRKDSQWAQALGPLENAVEHGGNRTQYAHLIAAYYREEYEAIFGPLSDLNTLPANAGPVDDPDTRAAWEAMTPADREAVTRIYTNIGKAIAAYERLLQPGASRFDAYVGAVLANDIQQMNALYTADEVAGLRLFIGEANCLQCHNGPLFTDNHFHNTGVPVVAGLPDDAGRAQGAPGVLSDEFNCLSPYSDAEPQDCAELRFIIAEGEELIRAFRPPSLRGVAERAPFMHAGQFDTLEAVLNHYNNAPEAPAGHSEIQPLGLSDVELQQLMAFLTSLSAPVNADPRWLQPPGTTGDT